MEAPLALDGETSSPGDPSGPAWRDPGPSYSTWMELTPPLEETPALEAKKAQYEPSEGTTKATNCLKWTLFMEHRSHYFLSNFRRNSKNGEDSFSAIVQLCHG